MSTAPSLPTNVTAGHPGHAALHNDVNAAVNDLWTRGTETVTIINGDSTYHLTRLAPGLALFEVSGDVLDQDLPNLPAEWWPVGVYTHFTYAIEDTDPAIGVIRGADDVDAGRVSLRAPGLFNGSPLVYRTAPVE